MRLALVISSLSSGGAERVMSDLANHWAEDGHDVHLITLASPDEEPFYQLDSRIKLLHLNQLEESANIVRRLFNILKRLYRIRRCIKKINPDRILSFNDITNISVLIATRGFGVPVIVSERTNAYFSQIPKFYQILRTVSYTWSFKVLVQTQSAANYFKSMTNIGIIPNLINSTNNLKFNYSKCDRLISSGRLVTSKAFDLLIQAFSNLSHEHPNMTLTIYGEGPERPSLEKLILELNLENRVFLPGVVKNIHQKLAEADLFVFPSRFEGFPNALCEAMAVGLPIVATRCSGSVDVIQDGHNGLLVDVDDSLALEKALLRLINDAALREKIGEQAKSITQDYSPQKIYELWDQIMLK